jgi:CIC family chloride channel protein
MPDNQIRNLVACGAAGGIAATFNTPIAGSLFALEVILRQFNATHFSAIVISAVTADVVAYQFIGNARSFSMPLYSLESFWELTFFAILGVLAGIGAVIFIRLLERTADLFDNSGLPVVVRPAIGGLLLGGVGLFTVGTAGMPGFFGVGYDSMTAALRGELSLRILFAFFVLKILATVLTLGSGGSGGVFAPSLFMGAMLGGTIGFILNALFPTITAPPGAYALVGMAAFAAGAVHTPVTLIVMLLEMSGDYQLILPLMLGTVLSTAVSYLIGHHSIYTSNLLRRGVHLDSSKNIDVMQGILVGEGMSQVGEVVRLDMPLKELAAQFARTHSHGFPVVDEQGRLAGAVSIGDYERALREGNTSEMHVVDIATTDNLIVTYPDEPMSRALRRLAKTDIGRIPVVAHPASRELVGIIRRTDIIRAYDRAFQKHAHNQHRVEQLRLEEPKEAIFGQVEMFSQGWGDGRTMGEVVLPDHCQFVSVRRGSKLHVADPYTVMQAGDVITLFGTPESVRFVTRQLTSWHGADADIDQQPRHRELTVPAGADCCGRTVMELALPPDCLVISVRRDDKVIIAHGDTALRAGDMVELFGSLADLDVAQALFCFK